MSSPAVGNGSEITVLRASEPQDLLGNECWLRWSEAAWENTCIGLMCLPLLILPFKLRRASAAVFPPLGLPEPLKNPISKDLK